ncbi:MAG: hypothetical protein H6626_05285 [Pseudobdellovibrionaceae bacterium]|nr:MAG: hypothetical protein H6626_05285 [Pseudobdellovibrionaceae bacterium]
MENTSRIILIKHLEDLVEVVSKKERQKNNRLRGKTKKIVKLTNYLKAIAKNQKEIN